MPSTVDAFPISKSAGPSSRPLPPVARITVPILALAGGGDWAIAPPAPCEDLVEATSSADRTFVACGRAEGFGEDFTHNRLIVSTPARREVWPLIADWIESRFA